MYLILYFDGQYASKLDTGRVLALRQLLTGNL